MQTREIVRKCAVVGIFDMVFTGGEALMAFDSLIAGIEEASILKIGTSLNSNLIPITAVRANKLRDLGIKGVLTSFMGPDAATYDNVAQLTGSFDRAVKGLSIATNAGLGVTTNTVVTKTNLHRLKDTAKFVRTLGVTRFSATKVGHPTHCQEFSALQLSPDEFQTYLRVMAEIRDELGMEIMSLVPYPLCTVRDLERYGFTMGRRCSAGITTVQIGADRQVRPCPHSDERYGDILTDDFTGIWAGMQAYRTGEQFPSTCRTCRLFERCGGGCRVEAKMHGDISGPDPYWRPDEVGDATKSLSCLLAKGSKTWQSSIIRKFKMHPCRTRPEPFG